MLRSRPASWILLLATVLPFAFAQVASAGALYRCVYDGVARTSCCCPAKPAEAPVSHPTASKSCCCDVEPSKVDLNGAQGRLERTDHVVPRAPVYPLPLPLRFAREAQPSAPMQIRAGLSPPFQTRLILLKSSLLI